MSSSNDGSSSARLTNLLGQSPTDATEDRPVLMLQNHAIIEQDTEARQFAQNVVRRTSQIGAPASSATELVARFDRRASLTPTAAAAVSTHNHQPPPPTAAYPSPPSIESSPERHPQPPPPTAPYPLELNALNENEPPRTATPSPSHILVSDREVELQEMRLDKHDSDEVEEADVAPVAGSSSSHTLEAQNDESNPAPPPGFHYRGSGVRARRQSILDSAPTSSRCIQLKNGRFVPPPPVIHVPGQPKPVKVEPFANNRIRSARYEWWNFIPLNLAQQLMRPANAYFCAIAVLQVIPAISISAGKPTILLPLLFVLIISAVKDAIEDLKRSKADREENERIYLRLTHTSPPGFPSGSPYASFEPVACKDIEVGDLVKITDEQSFPADLYLMYSSLEQKTTQQSQAQMAIDAAKRSSMKRASSLAAHAAAVESSANSMTTGTGTNKIPSTNPDMFGGAYCYVETANLDGESNLKVKLVSEFTREMCDEPTLIQQGHLDLRVEPPNGKLDKFGGMISKSILGPQMNPDHVDSPNLGKGDGPAFLELQEQVLTLDNLLLRGSRLRNTGFIYGLVVYTGEESKIRMNSRARALASVKRSSVERLMNKQIYIMFVLQVCFCFIGGLLAGIWQQQHHSHTYLFVDTISPVVVGVQRFFTWYIIFSGFVPISLLVSLEVVKFAQGIFMGLDIGMCHYIPGQERTGVQAKKKSGLLKGGGTDSIPGSPSLSARPPPGSLGAGKRRERGFSNATSGPTASLNGSTRSLQSDSPALTEEELLLQDMPGELQFARAQTSGLNEQLGQVKFILSDKTGTLTCNSMDFRKAFIGKLQYGTGTTDMMQAVAAAAAASKDQAAMEADQMSSWEETLLSVEGVKTTTGNIAAKFNLPRTTPHVNFNARDQLLLSLQGLPPSATAPSTPQELQWQQRRVHAYFMNLVLCNSVFPTTDDFDAIVFKASSPDEEALVEMARFCGYELQERSPPFVSIMLTGPAAALVESEEEAAEERKGQEEQKDSTFKPSVGLLQKSLEYEQLALLDFTSKRKRMSVILRDPVNGKIHIFCKGADLTVLPLLSRAVGGDQNKVPDWIATSESLTRFSDEGLRTLVICSSQQPAAFWDDPSHGWGIRYSRRMKDLAVEGPNEEGHFKGACKQACRRCALEEELELSAGLELVGGTAIEDKLQRDVPATIKSLLDAGIKVWVLTGDKLETAINIGMACNLLESKMERYNNLLKIDADSLHSVTMQVQRAYERVRELVAKEQPDHINRDIDEDAPIVPGTPERPLLAELPAPLNTPVGLVLESHAYTWIMNSLNPGEKSSVLLRKFLYVATHCKSVVACRCQPATKSSIVQLIKDTQNATTLAIGDGANDEPMIRAAGVGVGIRGVEGTTAVQASDYAISQFSFLRRLLFVHGHLSLRRVSILISYIFYKTSLMCFCVFWFGIFSGFSGQNLVMEWAYQLYNVLFTSLPILIFAVFDRDISPEVLEQHPDIYRITSISSGYFFNPRTFWSKWMSLSFIHSIIIFIFPYCLYQSTSVETSGQSQGMWEFGVLIYTSVVLVTNLRLALLFRSWTWLHHASLWSSIGAYFGAMLILNLSSVFGTAGGDYFGSVSRLFRTGSFWVTLLITVLSALYFDILIESLDRFKENREQAVRYAHLREKLPTAAELLKKRQLLEMNKKLRTERRLKSQASERTMASIQEEHPKDSQADMIELEMVGQKEVHELDQLRVAPIPLMKPTTALSSVLAQREAGASIPRFNSKADVPVATGANASSASAGASSTSASSATPSVLPSSPSSAQASISSSFGSHVPLISPQHNLIQPMVRAPVVVPAHTEKKAYSVPKPRSAQPQIQPDAPKAHIDQPPQPATPPPTTPTGGDLPVATRAADSSSTSAADDADDGDFASWGRPLEPHAPFSSLFSPSGSSERPVAASSSLQSPSMAFLRSSGGTGVGSLLAQPSTARMPLTEKIAAIDVAAMATITSTEPITPDDDEDFHFQ